MSRWVGRWLPVVTVVVVFPLLPAMASNGKPCDRPSLNQAIEQLQDQQKRAEAQTALQQCGEASAQPLALALNNDSATTRLYAAETLGQLGWEAKSAVPDLVSMSQEENRNPKERSEAIQALSAIGRAGQNNAVQLQGWQTTDIQELQDLQHQLSELLKLLKEDQTSWTTKATELDTLQRTNNSLQTQLRNLTNQPSYWVASSVQNPLVIGTGLVLIGIGGVYGGIFLCKPLWLLEKTIIDSLIEGLAKMVGQEAVVSQVLERLSPLKYHPRVLDAWVKNHISNVRKKLLLRETIKSHTIHIEQSVWQQGKQVGFKPENFADLFKEQFRLVIWGEGGAGKTSLACQFAHWAMWGNTGEKDSYRDDQALVKKLCRHRMIPIWIEERINEDQSLLDAISAKLKELIGTETSDELLKKLLQERRILVIVDHLSEIVDESTRQKIRPSKNKDYPVNALIATSRDPEILGNESITHVQPSRITTSNLAEFLNKYLPEKQKLEGIDLSFNPDDYAEAYKDLGNMISLRQAAEKERGQTSGTTILLVTLYASQMIVEKQKQAQLRNQYYYTTKQNLANNVPDLMLNYLDILRNNSSDETSAFPEKNLTPELRTNQVREIAQLVAWKCVEKNYAPESASREDVVKALTDIRTLSPDLATNYLEYFKSLSLVQFQTENRSLRLSLDPLTEYLAALYKLWEYRDNQDAWMLFLNDIKTTVNPNDVRGFLLALYDCCDKKGRGEPIRIPEDVLKELIELAKLDQAKVDAYYRERRMRLALTDLKELSPTYQLRAVADLATIARDDQTLKPSALRCLTEVLEDDSRVAQVRRESGKTLRQLGHPVLLLVPEIRGGVEYLHLEPHPKERIVNLSDSVTLELVQIPAGEFWMGAESEEDASSDELPRHKVRVPSYWMGRYPVTQAQWQVVAGWDKIKDDLETEPSYFKGGDRPVERVSWNEVNEFCARLSQHFQQFSDEEVHYRLPSEAEWEYACRAGMETPYHFGETITEELANFSGRNTPNETTSVGQYGVANRFGLYDMHGNVWEWCADHWHGSYEGVPTDGSAWLTDDENSERLLRGGSWNLNPGYCRSAIRYRSAPDSQHGSLGFRVVCVSSWTA